MVDIAALEAVAEMRGGSSPPIGTKTKKSKLTNQWVMFKERLWKTLRKL